MQPDTDFYSFKKKALVNKIIKNLKKKVGLV